MFIVVFVVVIGLFLSFSVSVCVFNVVLYIFIFHSLFV